MRKTLTVATAAALAYATAAAGPLALPAPPRAGFTQNIGTVLPLQQHFVDDDGTPVRLQQLLGAHGTLLLFGYYRCPTLCSVVGAGVFEALARSQSADAVPIVEIGIDASETPADAAGKKAEYARRFGSLAGRAHLLTGAPGAIDAVAAAGGFGYSYDAAQAQYVHPAGFLVITPQGRISRYFLGVRFDARELREAIEQAGGGRTGSVLQRLLLLCAHYDPSSGRNDAAVMTAVRIVCLGVCILLAAWIWRRRRSRRMDA